MLGPFDYAIWLLSFLAEAYVVVCALIRKDFLRYLSVNLYVLALAASTVCRFATFLSHGFRSKEYFYLYYYSDGVVTIVMFLAIIGLYLRVFDEMRISQYIRSLALIILGATVLFSFLVVQRSAGSLTWQFVAELGQNLYFIGFLMTYILWGAVLKLRVTHLRLVLLVSAFGIFFGLQAATYGLRNLFPSFHLWRVLPPLLGAWLPLSLAYTFQFVPEEAGIAVARVAGMRTWLRH